MKILYIHGLSSSGNSGTAEHLRRLLPNDTIFSPDLPIEPMVALEMLKRLVKEEKINLVIGTSMGGMFAQKLQGTYKILVNPSLHVSRSMRCKLGINRFFSERQDGISEYEITPELCDRYEELEQTQCMAYSDEERDNTIALFGIGDDMVNCREEYCEHYTKYFSFPGGHRLTEDVIRKYVLPIIEQQRIILNEVAAIQSRIATSPLSCEIISDKDVIERIYYSKFRDLEKMVCSDPLKLCYLRMLCDNYTAIYARIEDGNHETLLHKLETELIKNSDRCRYLLVSTQHATNFGQIGYEKFLQTYSNFLFGIVGCSNTEKIEHVISYDNAFPENTIETFIIIGIGKHQS